MKKIIYLFSLSLSVLVLAVAIVNLNTACEGPAGEAGVDANATCTQCHNDNTEIFARTIQAGNSIHMTGGNFERNGADCAACHTSEGFVERMMSGEMEASAAIENPSPINCRTCHNIHIDYDSTDLALRSSAPVELWSNGVSVDIGKGNLCVNCHQTRIANPDPLTATGTVSITSSRWGPHHGPQGALLYGTAAAEIAAAGGKSYPAAGTNAHIGTEGCITCHMAQPYGSQAGGHTFRMGYLYHEEMEENLAGCNTCHVTPVEEFDHHGVQTEIMELTDSLHGLLVDKGWLVESSGLINASSSKPLVISADEAGAIYNFYFIEEDRSHGIHNPAYAMAVLDNSIKTVQP